MIKLSKADDLIKEERKKYYRKWRLNNKEKVKKYNDNYWRRRVEKKNEIG
jgi:hypothetical protein